MSTKGEEVQECPGKVTNIHNECKYIFAASHTTDILQTMILLITCPFTYCTTSLAIRPLGMTKGSVVSSSLYPKLEDAVLMPKLYCLFALGGLSPAGLLRTVRIVFGPLKEKLLTLDDPLDE